MSDINIKILVDHVGRTIIGELVEDTEAAYKLKNPCTIFVQPNEQGQLQVQTITLFFKEFLTIDGREKGTTFTFRKDSITDSDAAQFLDSKLKTQYDGIVANFAAPDEAPAGDSGEVVKLFDE